MRSFSGLKVLVADDHLLIREFVRNTIWACGIANVQTVADGNEVIDLVQRANDAGEPFDIVFLDWNMPTVTGLEVLSYVLSWREHLRTAFVMLTAESEQVSVMKAVKAGAASYIIKPVSAEDLRKKLFDIYDWVDRKSPAHE